MKLFDIVSALVSKPEEWKKVSDKDKNANFFMINRFMSIQFPYQANLFNKRTIESHSAVDCWRDVMFAKYNKIPNWIYTKTKKKEKDSTSNWEPSIELKQFWMSKNMVGSKEYDYMRMFQREELYSEMKEIEKNYKDMIYAGK